MARHRLPSPPSKSGAGGWPVTQGGVVRITTRNDEGCAASHLIPVWGGGVRNQPTKGYRCLGLDCSIIDYGAMGVWRYRKTTIILCGPGRSRDMVVVCARYFYPSVHSGMIMMMIFSNPIHHNISEETTSKSK
jgi:hypothetical protein